MPEAMTADPACVDCGQRISVWKESPAGAVCLPCAKWRALVREVEALSPLRKQELLRKLKGDLA